MTNQKHWYAGVDWASESHLVFLTDAEGHKIGEKEFKHSGDGLAEMTAWLMAISGAPEASQVLVAIEVPHGPVVETLMERGFKVHAINPKQMDRFRESVDARRRGVEAIVAQASRRGVVCRVIDRAASDRAASGHPELMTKPIVVWSGATTRSVERPGDAAGSAVDEH